MAATENNLRKALAALEKKHKKCPPLAPLAQLAYSVLAGEAGGEAAREGLGRLLADFDDLNEVRTARLAELARRLDPLPEADALAKRLREMLGRLFELRGCMDLLFLKEVKPLEARKHLLEIDPEMGRDTLALVLFELCPGTTLPLSPEGFAAARKLGLAARGGSKQQLQKTMQEQLSPEEAAQLVHYLELESGAKPAPAPAKKAKPAAKKAKGK